MKSRRDELQAKHEDGKNQPEVTRAACSPPHSRVSPPSCLQTGLGSFRGAKGAPLLKAIISFYVSQQPPDRAQRRLAQDSTGEMDRYPLNTPAYIRVVEAGARSSNDSAARTAASFAAAMAGPRICRTRSVSDAPANSGVPAAKGGFGSY